jgi:hypothetical protein
LRLIPISFEKVANLAGKRACEIPKSPAYTLLSFRPSGEIFKGAGNIRTSQDSSLCSE